MGRKIQWGKYVTILPKCIIRIETHHEIISQTFKNLIPNDFYSFALDYVSTYDHKN